MSEVFRVDVEDHNGNPVTVLKNFQYLSFEERVARRESFRLQLADNDPNRELIGLDYIMRVWYKNDTFNIPWTNIFNGINKTPSRVYYSNGRKLAIFYGSGSKEILDKSLVMYSSDSPQAAKENVNALTAMYEYIVENVGPLALISNGRFFNHVNPVTVTTVGTCSLNWSGNAAHDLLVKALQDIRDYTYANGDRIDFNCRYVGNYQWIIEVGKIYKDRTANGVDINTGLNGVGNVPVVLSAKFNNVDEFVQTHSRISEANAILALGRYMGSARESLTVADIDSINISPIAQREYLLQAQNAENLLPVAESALKDLVGRTSLSITPKFSPGFALFRDLNIGDFFSVMSLEGQISNKQLDELKVVVQQTEGGSTISQYTMFVEDREP